jgi:putative oxidoreductase|tara:strand:+ start:2403 stop:2813 length:411 start_codon:yes stop_codon:yes gene_type:complete
MFKKIVANIPEFCMSHWLFRIPVSIVFIQQGLDKLPVDVETAESFGLTYLVWWVVAYGELGAGIGLLVGGLMASWVWLRDYGDVLTRFSGITVASIMTGVIWIGEPESFWDVVWYDNLHVFLWVGGMYFALRGNRT